MTLACITLPVSPHDFVASERPGQELIGEPCAGCGGPCVKAPALLAPLRPGLCGCCSWSVWMAEQDAEVPEHG